MSLILDALRKADSERERGSVPGLHAHPLPALAVETAQPPRVRAWQWALAGVVVVGALAWYFAERDTRPTPNESGALPAAPGAARAPLASSAPQAPPAPATSTAPTGARGELPQAAEPAPWPTRDSRGPAAAAKATQATAPAASSVPALSSAGQSSTTAPPIAPTADAPVYAVEQLPQHVRSQLPALTVTGAIYSPNPADRTLIVNGRLMRENQALTADLSLEQIGQKSAVLRFKGYRFELRF